ncbi:MAG: yunB [Firmicutes bacterium]|nr:yunB [Bacillota bacterium]
MRFSVRRQRSMPGFVLVMAITFVMVVIAFWIVENHLKPSLLAIAEARAITIATQCINTVINEKVSQSIDPQRLVIVQHDERGRVVFIQPNTFEFNRLAAETTIKVQEALQEIPEEKIYIPSGQVLGSKLLASMGPKIGVTVIPIGTVQVKVVDKFEQAGINQTRHSVYLYATTSVRIVVPLVSSVLSVNTQVPITEYIVVGEVPSTYVQFPFPLSNELNGNGSVNGE